jgi:3-keto-L-gulonate-6-phosphate decarboxylase
MLRSSVRYLQVAFNYDLGLVQRVLPTIARSERILIEAGTPYIKSEGQRGIRLMRSLWPGQIVHRAGATAATVLGGSPVETLDKFIAHCDQLGMISMIDMLGVSDPLKVLMPLRKPPGVVVLHRGRDEESSQGKVIQYRHVNRVRSKFNVVISAAGGVGLKEARSAIFNGAGIVVVNLVRPNDPWQGISTETDVGAMTRTFLETIS